MRESKTLNGSKIFAVAGKKNMNYLPDNCKIEGEIVIVSLRTDVTHPQGLVCTLSVLFCFRINSRIRVQVESSSQNPNPFEEAGTVSDNDFIIGNAMDSSTRLNVLEDGVTSAMFRFAMILFLTVYEKIGNETNESNARYKRIASEGSIRVGANRESTPLGHVGGQDGWSPGFHCRVPLVRGRKDPV